MKYADEMASCRMIHLQRFMKIDASVQGILRCCLRNFRGCNAGITDGRDFLISPLV
jgi:hypothetical protein